MHARGPRVDTSTADTTKMTIKLFIPVSEAKEDTVLCGLLEQLAPLEPTRGRKLALVSTALECRAKLVLMLPTGLRLCMDTWGEQSYLHTFRATNNDHLMCPRHKDYLYQRQLALRFPIDSFRFDFRYARVATASFNDADTRLVVLRGCNESTGRWNFGHFPDDVEDIRAVVAFLTSRYGYVIHLIVAHSRGSITAMNWMCTSTEGKAVTGFVNLSARYIKSVCLGGIDGSMNLS